MTTLDTIAQPNKLTLGLVFPLESYSGSVPKMEEQESLAQQAEALGFKALWFRDVPFHDPTFGDAGQMFDPWVYITHIMNHTQSIALGTASIILPLRHPIHTVKSINSIQLLSNQRLILGVASGDRPVEYPAFNQALQNKAELFRDSFEYIKALQQDFPVYSSQHYGKVQGGIDVLPKYPHKTPMLVTGHSGQNLDWIAQHADGWIYYPRNFQMLQLLMHDWKKALAKAGSEWKPFMQSLYIDLVEDSKAKPTPLHLGFKSGTEYLIAHLKQLETFGVNHVILNLKYASRSAAELIDQLSNEVLPEFE